MNLARAFINVVEDTIISHAELPDRLHMLESRSEAGQRLTMPRACRGLVDELILNGLENPLPIVGPKTAKLGNRQVMNLHFMPHHTFSRRTLAV